MRRFVEILTGESFVHYSFHELPDDFEPQYDTRVLTMVDVTNLPETPRQGDYYDGSSFVFVDRMPGQLDSNTFSADGIDLCVLRGLPIPCTVLIDAVEYQVDDGVFEFTTTMPGVYAIKVKAFPYIIKTWEATAV